MAPFAGIGAGLQQTYNFQKNQKKKKKKKHCEAQ
jgi:hypothetical protein